jgi:hypothetical protein
MLKRNCLEWTILQDVTKCYRDNKRGILDIEYYNISIKICAKHLLSLELLIPDLVLISPFKTSSPVKRNDTVMLHKYLQQFLNLNLNIKYYLLYAFSPMECIKNWLQKCMWKMCLDCLVKLKTSDLVVLINVDKNEISFVSRN